MGPIYIAVADTNHARIYQQEGRGQPLHLVDDLRHPDAAKHNAQLGSDRPGLVPRKAITVSGRAVGAHPSVYVPHTEPKTVEQNRFAREVAGKLNRARAGGRFAELVLAMGPRMLGLVRGELSLQAARSVSATIEHDLVHLSDQELGRRLRADWFVPDPAFRA